MGRMYFYNQRATGELGRSGRETRGRIRCGRSPASHSVGSLINVPAGEVTLCATRNTGGSIVRGGESGRVQGLGGGYRNMAEDKDKGSRGRVQCVMVGIWKQCMGRDSPRRERKSLRTRDDGARDWIVLTWTQQTTSVCRRGRTWMVCVPGAARPAHRCRPRSPRRR
ncbi:hypothetical protein AG1IA_03589 [Rhizoctonia solani AG-1 IA]|uniref:Uncharacterized protein n=1 Tax=Thanatephorus cucumeris (strain AG1-IA) TaxID=983506 RepID=L8WWC6_THACA|nr:hypothetical protein AG1IA_03589 [Rhizoctonia solani AG-1 IA]